MGVRQRQLIDSIEDEVLFWRNLDQRRTKHGQWSPGRDTMAMMPWVVPEQARHSWVPGSELRDRGSSSRNAGGESRSSTPSSAGQNYFNVVGLPEQTVKPTGMSRAKL